MATKSRKPTKPQKPTPDYPLFPHASGLWAKKVEGKLRYFGPWADPQAALERYNAWLTGQQKPSSLPQPGKTGKPRKDFPLYRHRTGQWAKRVRGKVHYFGTNRDAALRKWAKQKDDLLAGREPQNGEGLTVGRLSNVFLAYKQCYVDSGEITQRTWDDYEVICERVVAQFGPGRLVANLRPQDFKSLREDFAKTHGPVALHNDIGRARVMFNHAFKQGLIDRPVLFGDSFKKPKRAVLRRERQKKGKKMFQADEIRAALDNAGVQLRAMVFLGINCGLGNNDCVKLAVNNLDLEGGWLDYPRPKTAIHRRCPLWSETVDALRLALKSRPTPKDEDYGDRVFITKYGTPWEPKSHTDNPVTKEMAKLLKDLKIHRKGVGFYALRHTFETIGRRSRDNDAVRTIMGHVEAPNDMSAVYNEEAPDDARLRAVTDYVHAWLFPPKSKSVAGQAEPADESVHAAAETGS